MPLSDRLLSQGNPENTPIGVEPVLASPSPPTEGENPVFPQTFFYEGKERLDVLQGPSLDDWLKPITTKPRQVASPMIGVDELLANKRYKYYQPGVDNEEIAAQGQSTWDKWANAFVKMGATAVGTFAQSFMTVPDTINAIHSGKLSSLYQSGEESAVDTWLKNLEDSFPNYYSKWEKEHPFTSAIPFTGGGANFWGDKVLKNLGFTIGAIGGAVAQDALVAGVTGGLGDIPLVSAQIGKAALWLNKIFSGTNDISKLFQTGREIGASADALLGVKNLGNIAVGIKVGNQAKYALNLIGAARTEGGVESRQGYNDLKKDLTDEFRKNNGYSPQGEDLNKIENFATASANVRFGINMALLTVSDAIQFENFLRPIGAFKVEGVKPLKVLGIDTIEPVVPTTAKGKIWNIVKKQIPNILSEGVYEEGGQYAAQIGTYDYYKNKYDDSTKSGLSDIINSTVKGLAGQFGSSEGVENMFLGAITAILSGGATHFKEGEKLDENTRTILSTLQANKLTGILGEHYNDTAKSVGIKRDMADAVSKNDVFQYKNLQHDLFYNFIQSGEKAGRFDVRIEQLKMLKELDQPEFEKMFGMDFTDDSNKHTVSSYVDGLIGKANDIRDNIRSINKVFTNPYSYTDTPKTGDEAEENLNHLTFEHWKNELSYNSSFIKDSNKRSASISSDITSISPLLSTDILKSITNRKSLEGLKNIYETKISYFKDEENREEDPLIKAQRRANIKDFTAQAENIGKALATGVDPENAVKLLGGVLEFESVRSGGIPLGIPKDKIEQFLTYGKDLNQLEDRKKIAAKAFDILATEEGWNKFNKDFKEKEAEATAVKPIEEALPTPTTTAPTFKNKEGKDEEIVVGRRFATDKNLVYTLTETVDGRWEVKSPDGSIVYTNKSKEKAEEFRKVADSSIGGLAELTIEAINPDGTIKVGDSKGNISDIPVNSLTGYERTSTPEEKFLEDKKLQEELQRQQLELQKFSGSTITNIPNESIPFGSSLKPIENIASTTDPSLKSQPAGIPERTRNWVFLNNIRSMPNRNAMRVITVTANNEDAVGLSGLTKYKMPSATQEELNNPDIAPIFAVYTQSIGKDLFFVDVNGKSIGKVGEKIDFNRAVFSTLSSTSITNTKGEFRFTPKEGDKGSLVDYQNAWRERRKELLAMKNTYHVSEFNVSKGFPLENKIEGKPESNPIVGTLISKEDIDKEGLIEIPTIGKIVHNGIELNFPVGRPILRDKDTIIFLNNRNLVKDEAVTIYNVLRAIAREGVSTRKLNRQAVNYLQGILYFGSPQEGKTIGRNQLWIDSGYLHIGDEKNNGLKVPFTEESLKAAGASIIDQLLTTYNNVNNHLLKRENFNTPYEEITGVNPDNTFKSTIWKNYQTYLLSPRANAPLSTTVRKRVDRENDYNFEGKYITLTSQAINVVDTREKKAPIQKLAKEAATLISTPPTNTTNTEIATPTQAGGIVFDGKTTNTYTTGQGLKFSYTASISPETGDVSVQLDLSANNTKDTIDQLMPTARQTLEKTFGLADPLYEKFEDDSAAAMALMIISATNKAKAASLSPSTEITEVENKKKEERLENRYAIPSFVPKKYVKKGENIVLSGDDLKLADARIDKIVSTAKSPEDAQERLRAAGYALTIPEVEAFKGFVKDRIENKTKRTFSEFRQDVREEKSKEATIISEPPVKAEVITSPTIIQGTPRADEILSKPKEDLPREDRESKFRDILNGTNVERENEKSVRDWIKTNLPQVPYSRVKNLIQNTNGGYSWGVFRDGAIYVYENAQVGTTYHEAFHAVWNLFTTPRERQNIINEIKGREGYRHLSTDLVEEKLAEDFSDYVQNNKIPPKPIGVWHVIQFFKDLLNTIKSWLLGKSDPEDLFRKIGQGYFRTANPNIKNFSSPEKSSIAPVFNEQISHEIMQGVSARFIQNMFKEGKSLVELEEANLDTEDLYAKVYEELRREYEGYMREDIELAIGQSPQNKDLILAKYESQLKIWDDIKANWSTIVQSNKDFLKTFGLINEEKNDEPESNLEQDLNNEDRSGRSDGHLRDMMKIDHKKNASTAIKLLFATLIETDRNKPVDKLGLPRPDYSSIGQYQLVDMGKAFNHVMHNISNTNSLTDMVGKLSDLSKDFPNYVRLFTRLKGDATTGEIGYTKLDVNDWGLLLRFFNSFAKQKPRALIQIIDEGGASYTVGANFGDNIKSTVSEWIDGIKSLSRTESSLIKYNKQEKHYEIDVEKLKEFYPTRTLEQRVKFLKVLGIDFPLDLYNKLPDGAAKGDWDKAVTSIAVQLASDNKIMTVQGRTLGITGPLNTLAELYTRTNGDFSESTFYNADGERVQTFVHNNYLSMFMNEFNKVNSRDELLITFPQLVDGWSSDSETLKLGGRFFKENGERTGTKLELGYIDGTINMRTKKGKPTSKLTIAERRLQEFNQNIRGKFFSLVPADSKTEWLLSIGNFIEYPEMFQNEGQNKIYTRFNSYLQTEIEQAIIRKDRQNILNLQGKGKEGLAFFKNILSEDMRSKIQQLIDRKDNRQEVEDFIRANKEAIDKSVQDFIDKEVDTLGKDFTRFSIIQYTDKGIKFNGLDQNFTSNHRVGDYLSEAELNNLLQMRVINYIVANIEQHKILFGDPYLIKDPTKRIKSFLSGTETTLYNTPEFDNFANRHYNTLSGGIELKEGDVGYHRFKDYMPSVTADDVISSGDIYEDNNEADSQTWMKDTTYREFMIKSSRWNNALEKQFQYELAWSRDYLNQYGDNIALKEADKALLDKGNPSSASFVVLKPKGSGQKDTSGFIDLYLDKTSAAPLFLRHITLNGTKSTNLANLYKQMGKQGIGYVIVKSGRKVGAEGLHPLYNEDGTFNTKDFDKSTIINIPYRNYGIQQETTSAGNKKQTRGSQMVKIATIDLLEGKVPVDYLKGDKDRFEKWHNLSEEEKVKISPIYEKVKRNQKLLEDLTQDGYDKLLRKLGIEDTGEGFITTDKEKIVKFLQSELFRREMDDNTKAGISLNKDTGDFTFPLEANPKYLQIKNILYSVVDKQIASPTVNGGAKIEISAAMWEEGSREVVKGKLRTSNALKFYTKEDPYMEIMLPHWFKEALSHKGIIGDDEKILQQLKGSKILTGIGFRIPTQALSAIDAFRIKGFLPQEMGNVVVVPAELTTKAGTDFDVDKLNTYLKNIEVDRSGRITYVEYKGSKEATIDFYTKKFDKLLAEKLDRTENFLNAVTTLIHGLDDERIIKKYQKLLDEVMTDTTEDEVKKTLDKLQSNEVQDDLRDRYVQRMYSQSLENAYFESLEELITLPENFDRLLSANTDKTLKGLRDELDELKGTNIVEKVNNPTLLISPSYMSQTRHNFIVGAGGIGIAALAQTGHSLAQRFSMYVNTDKIETTEGVEKDFLGDGIVRLPHNKVVIGGKEYASLSGILDTAGKYISDKLSEYINGYVDISKDAFITEIGAIINAGPIFILLERLGVPTQDVVFFMNQPVIKEFLGELEKKGWSNLLNTQVYAEILAKFMPQKLSKLSGEEMLNTKNFKNNIREYYKEGKQGDKMTEAFKLEQYHIFKEFIKYAVMANHLFEVTIGSNYDTANFNDPNLFLYKYQQTQIAASDANIISSVGGILDNSFLGTMMKTMMRTRNVIGEAVPIVLEQQPFRQMLNLVKRVFGQKGTYNSERDKLRIARAIETSFVDYVMQTKLHLNNRIGDLMIDAKTSVANELHELKLNLPKKIYDNVRDNRMLKELVPSPSDREFGAKNVRLKTRDNDAYTTNLYTGALRELRDNVFTRSLYNKLVRLSLLQSGLRQTPNSFGHLIPVEDYAAILTPMFKEMHSYTGLDNFLFNHSFFRNYWKDDKIVPKITPKYFEATDFGGMPRFEIIDGEMMFELTSPIYYSVPQDIRNLRPTGANNINFIALHEKYNGSQLKYPIVKVEKVGIDPVSGFEYTSRDIAKMRKAGNYSYRDVTLYAVVQDPANPAKVLRVPHFNTAGQDGYKVIYKMINAWGDGQNAQEYYEDGRPSLYDNGTTKNLAGEIPDHLIVAAYNGDSLIANTQSIENKPTEINQAIASSNLLAASENIFEFIQLDKWKKASKKEEVIVSLGGIEKDITEGYRINFEGHPNLLAFAVKEGRKWSIIEGSTGQSISGGLQSTIKIAVEAAKYNINKAAERPTNTKLLAEIKVGQAEKVGGAIDEFTKIINDLKVDKVIKTDC